MLASPSQRRTASTGFSDGNTLIERPKTPTWRPDEPTAILRVVPELGRAEVVPPLATVWERMPTLFLEEAPHVEVMDAAVTVHVVSRGTLAQADQEHPPLIRA